ncbi:hypothetical protein A0H81_12054 [Grifola frondosa]|uniref:Uncharacterized protein n=1 Tax=Grifola frondosa TaxID=5627 RepID=A0A1C7LTX3_GRIFR|nr:hypothetical protein A0H81_12054 [Grifola frondosa]
MFGPALTGQDAVIPSWRTRWTGPSLQSLLNDVSTCSSASAKKGMPTAKFECVSAVQKSQQGERAHLDCGADREVKPTPYSNVLVCFTVQLETHLLLEARAIHERV